MAGSFDIRLSDTAKVFDIDLSVMSRSVTRLRSAPMMTVLSMMYTNLDGIDNFDRINVTWLYPLSLTDQGGAPAGGVFQPVKHRQQGTPFTAGYADRPPSWNPL